MTDSNAASRSKVARLIQEYDLRGLGDDLEERWTRTEDRRSLRELAEYFNRRLLAAALDDADADPLEGEVENLYRLLTGDEDVSSGVRTQTKNRLEQQGIEVDQLLDDFVSRQAIHTYLTKYRDVSQPEDEASPEEHRDRKLETIQRLQSRLNRVTERALGDLSNANRLTLGEFSVIVTVRVHCADCNTQYSIGELLRSGSCDCT